jgi:hypothetical protein
VHFLVLIPPDPLYCVNDWKTFEQENALATRIDGQTNVRKCSDMQFKLLT